MRDIGAAQNEEINLTRQLAARRLYSDAKFLHFFGSTISFLLPLAVPFFVLDAPDIAEFLGAFAGLWIFVSRVLLVPWRDKWRLMGARAQEMFDCNVLALEWNPALADPLAHEDIHAAARRAKRKTIKKRKPWRVGDWYPTNTDADWPKSVLICQRSNAVWARRQHGGYGWLLVGVAALLFVAGIIFGLSQELSLAAYLSTIALPSLPALLDATEEAKEHFKASEARQRLERETQAQLDGDGEASLRLRGLQDQLFSLRHSAPLVPDWFYRLRREKLESDMRDAAKEIAQ